MNFIKKNIVLFSVLLIAIIISGVFIYLVIVETKEMNEAIIQVEELKKKINDLNKQSPIPSKDNYERISADAKVIELKTKEAQQVFGRPYRQAIEVLLKELDTPREEFFTLWKKTYEEEVDKGSHRGLIFNRFFSNFDKGKVDKALSGFKDKVEEISVEPLNEANIDGCIMEAMGLPRKMEPIPCKKYIMDMTDNLIIYMKQGPCASCGKIIPGEDFKAQKCSKCNNSPGDTFTFGTGKADDVVEKLTFEKFQGTSIPRPDEVSYLFRHFKLIEDLLSRIKQSGIKNLNGIAKEKLQGVTTDGYMVFTYTIRVTGPLNSIRNLVNSLKEAYRDSRIYVIKSVTLKARENAKSIVSDTDVPKTGRKRGKKEPEKPEEPEEAGIPIIGNDDTVEATIKFEYVIFIGDELTEND